MALKKNPHWRRNQNYRECFAHVAIMKARFQLPVCSQHGETDHKLMKHEIKDVFLGFPFDHCRVVDTAGSILKQLGSFYGRGLHIYVKT